MKERMKDEGRRMKVEINQALRTGRWTELQRPKSVVEREENQEAEIQRMKADLKEIDMNL